MAKERPRTLGELRASGYRFESVKDEMRRNLIVRVREGRAALPGHPRLRRDGRPAGPERHPLEARHALPRPPRPGQDADAPPARAPARRRDADRRRLGGQRRPVRPALASTPATSSPRRATTRPIEWVGREDRYHEKLATPDVTIADLIGEIDMIKHAEGRYLSSELTMHFGLIPRTNRGIFCINELPDLSPKIQVGLFNVLEERDVQIRGYPIRLDLDLCLVFSANPEDYTNRGRIVTPLKDRIGSVVRTHYPLTRELGHRRSATRTPGSTATAAPAGDPVVHQGDRRGDLPAGADVVARQPAVGRLGPDVDRQPGERGLQRRAAGPDQRRALDRAADLRPGARRRQLARQDRADDDRGRRPGGQADRPDRRPRRSRTSSAATSTSASSARRSSTSSRARGSRSATRSRSATSSRGSRRSPASGSGPRSWPGRPSATGTTPRPATPPPPARPSSSSKGCTSTTS